MRIFWIAILAALLWCAPAAPAQPINVAAAVSLREAMTDTARAYQADGGPHVEFTFGASGQLAAQIQNGAPVDAFISAAGKQMDDLSKAGLLDDSTRRIIAGNDLVLIVPAGENQPPTGFAQLSNDSVKKIAVGEPKTVPAGQYAMQTLKALKLDDALAPRLVFGASVRQVLEYVESGEVSAGIVYSTDAMEAGAKVKVVAVADESTHDPILYPAAVIKNSLHRKEATQFLDYLTSEKGLAVLSSRGFTRGSTPTTIPVALPAAAPGK